MFSLLQRAHLYTNLTPGERALLKIVEGLIVSAIIAGIVAALPAVSTQNLSAINWMAVGSVFAAAAGKTLYDGVSKYFKSFGDPPLPPAPTTADTGA
jgi:hypothetical protein